MTRLSSALPATSTDAPVSARKMAVNGAVWTFIGYGGAQLLRLGSNLILAWLLFPGAFGLMALVNVFMQGLQMFSDIGLGPSVIRNKRGHEAAFLNTAWTMQISRGFGLWILACLLAYPAAQFYGANDPAAQSLLNLLPVAALVAVISGFNSTGVFLLNRSMNLRLVTGLELIPQLVATLVMIVWALLDASVWALVAGNLAASLTKLALSHAWNPGPANRLGWERESFQELFHFGKWIFLSTLVTFLASNLDRIMLGKTLSLAELGIYAIAMTFARVAIHIAGRLSSTVIFPLLSRLQDDPRRVVEACLRGREPVLWLSGAVCAGFALAAPLFFGTLYDPRYAGAGLISQWLAIYVWSHILNDSMDRIALALGEPRQLFNANVLKTVTLVLALPAYTFLGLPGFILCMTLANMSAHVYLVSRLPFGRARMVRQDAFFSAGLLLYTVPIILMLQEPALLASPWLHALAIIVGAAPLMAVGAWKIWHAVREPQSRAAAA